MRLGWDASSIVAPDLAADLERAGVAAITIHGRTAAQAFRGRACQDGIARVVAAVQRIPIIGNGDVRCPADALAMIGRTGCAGVMIGRAALSDPWIFRDTHALLTTGRVPTPPTLAERLDFIRRHFEHTLRIRGERRACITFRQRVSWYLKAIGSYPAWRERFRGLASAAEFRRLMEEFPAPIKTA
jgi:tRNA-dihydrouridine synthase